MINQIIKEGFASLGFTEKEVQIYLFLADNGATTVQSISRYTHIPRTTIYSIVNKLCEKGVVVKVEEEGQKKNHYAANDPTTLFSIILKERAKVTEKEGSIKQLVDLIMPFFHPRLQYFDGPDNVQKMLNEFLPTWFEQHRQHDNTLWGYQDPRFVEHYYVWLKKYWREKDADHKICLFSNKSSFEKSLENKVPDRAIKEFPAQALLGSTIWINGDYVTIIVIDDEQHYAVQIKDAVFGHDLRNLFKTLWRFFG